MIYIERSGRMSAFFERVLQTLYPMGTYCLCCGKYIDLSRTYCLCDHCIRAIEWGHIFLDLEKERSRTGRTFYLDSAMSCMVYGLYSRSLIFELKYNRRTYVSRVLSQIAYDRITTDPEALEIIRTVDFIVPVPLHRKKENDRGFNQAELIARHLVKRLNSIENNPDLRLLSHALVRNRPTPAQRSVSGAERFSNLENAFSVPTRYRSRICGSDILLLDDIFTTGSTADQCARELKASGASHIHVLSLATGNDYLHGIF